MELDEKALRAAMKVFNSTLDDPNKFGATARIVKAYLESLPAPLKGAYTQEMTDAFTEAQFRGVSAETQAELDAIDDNIRAAHMMASTTFVGGRTSSAQVEEHQPASTENQTRA